LQCTVVVLWETGVSKLTYGSTIRYTVNSSNFEPHSLKSNSLQIVSYDVDSEQGDHIVATKELNNMNITELALKWRVMGWYSTNIKIWKLDICNLIKYQSNLPIIGMVSKMSYEDMF
jgi:hypothetical protein